MGNIRRPFEKPLDNHGKNILKKHWKTTETKHRKTLANNWKTFKKHLQAMAKPLNQHWKPFLKTLWDKHWKTIGSHPPPPKKNMGKPKANHWTIKEKTWGNHSKPH
jgi:hypothetical protein